MCKTATASPVLGSDRRRATELHRICPRCPSGGIEAVTQSDRIPVDWLRPTDGWRPGEILEDIHNLGISPLPPGDYDIFVGFYDPETLVRVPVSQNGIPMPNDVLLLTTITVP